MSGYFNRPEAKYRARLAMQGAYPHPMLVTLVYTILTSWLVLAVTYLVANPFSIAMPYLMRGYEMEDILYYIFTPGRVGAYLLMQLILTLYQWVMQFGYTAYALGLARRTGPGYRTLLDGFSQLGRALGVSFFTALFTSLWGLLAMVPYFVVLTVGAMAQSYALIMFSTVLALLAVVVEIAVSYRYRLATYFLLDDINMGVLASIRESKQTMHGRKGALFVMDLSFLGWGLLSLITFGVVGLWASPYMWAAEANFYHWARWGTFPGEGPQPGGPQPGGYQSPYQKF